MGPGGIRQRVIRGVGAQAFGHVVRVAIQLVSVSLFIPFWGLHRYGEWLILTAVPSYLAFSDVGFVSAAVNDIIMSTARGETQKARAVFQSIIVVLGVVALTVVVSLPIFAAVAPLGRWLNISTLNEVTIGWTILTLGLNACLVLWGSLLYGGFASVGKYGNGAIWIALTSLVEFCALALAVVLGAGVGVAAGAMLVGRLVCTGLMAASMARAAPFLRPGRPPHLRAELRRLLSPALASGAFPLGFALTLQGMVILVGVTLGPASAAIFSTLRTLSRAVIQLLASVSAVAMPEVSKAYGEGNVSLLRELNRRACQVATWITVPAVILLAVSGSVVLHVWTSGRVGTEGSLLYLFLAITVVDIFWYTNIAVLIATNRHQRVAMEYVVGCVLTLPLGWLLVGPLGLPGATLALLALELFMLGAVLRRTLPAVGDRLSQFALAVVRPPWYLLAGLSRLRWRSADVG